MAKGKPIGSFYVQLGLNTQSFRKNLQGAQRELRTTFGSAALQTSQALAASMVILSGAIAAVGASSVKLAANLEVQTVAFKRFLGSADAAEKKLRELQTFAAETPFTFTELTDYTKRLIALGFAAEDVTPLLTVLGDTASGLGLDAGGMNRLIKAFGDIQSKGVLATQEIKQLGENGVAAFQMLANQLTKGNVPEVIKMIEDRAIDSATAITALTTELNQRFGGMMEIQAKTMIGLWSTVRDETENIGRSIGASIIESLNLKDALIVIKEALRDLRVEIEERGVFGSMNNLLGPKMKIAAMALAGAITGALIPAIVKLGTSLTLALAPLAPLAAAFGAIAGALTAAYLVWKKFGPEIKTTFAGLPEIAKAAFSLIKSGVEALASVIFKIAEKVFSGIYDRLSQSNNRIKQAIAPVFQSISEVFKTSGDYWKESSKRSLENAVKLGETLNRIFEIYEAEKNVADFSDWTGIENLAQLWQKIEKLVNSTKSAIKTQFAPLTSFFKNITGQGRGATTQSAPENKTPKQNPLIEDARQTAAAIEREWINLTKSKQEQLDYEYQLELDNLNKSRSVNKNYYRDLQRLSEVYSAKGRALMEQDFIAREEYLTRQQQEELAYLAERDNAFFESQQAKINGWELEQQLMQDMQAGDLEAFIQHLNAKASAERSYLEGRREAIQQIDQFERDTSRSTLSYITEGYQTFYNGLTNALVNIGSNVQKAGEAFKQLGLQMIQMVLRQMIQQRLAHGLGESLKAASTASSIAQAQLIAAAWAPAAAMVNAATFGQAVTSSVSSFKALSGALSGLGGLPMFAEGAFVSKPTLAWVGEGKEPEWVLPESKLNSLLANAGGAGPVQINIVNNSGVPITAKASQRMDGKRVVADLLIEAVNSNTSGIGALFGR